MDERPSLRFTQQKIDDPAAPNVRLFAPAVIQDVGAGTAGFFEDISEDWQAVKGTFLVEGLGKTTDTTIVPGQVIRKQGGRFSKRVVIKVTKNIRLITALVFEKALLNARFLRAFCSGCTPACNLAYYIPSLVRSASSETIKAGNPSAELCKASGFCFCCSPIDLIRWGIRNFLDKLQEQFILAAQ